MTARSFGANRLLASLTAVAVLVLSGCVATNPAPAPSGAEAADVYQESAPGLDAAFFEAARVVQEPGYAVLKETLSALPGFLGLSPALDGSKVLHAVYAGDVTMPVILPILPEGWTLKIDSQAGQPQRMRQKVDKVIDLFEHPEYATMLPPTPAASTGIGPGSPLLITIPGEGTFICTANWIFEDTGVFYLGAAGHCFLPSDETTTHGGTSNYDASGVTTRVCVSSCYFGGQLTGFLGGMTDLGTVAYARQTSNGGADIGNDFGIVVIPTARYNIARPTMPMWLGPTGEDSFEGTGRPLVHYGNGIDFGTVFPTKGRAGVGVNDGVTASWQASIFVNGGDSGSAIGHAQAMANADVVRGAAALGLITHGLIVPGVPLGWGTTVDRAIDMATEASIDLTLVLQGDTIP